MPFSVDVDERVLNDLVKKAETFHQNQQNGLYTILQQWGWDGKFFFALFFLKPQTVGSIRSFDTV